MVLGVSAGLSAINIMNYCILVYWLGISCSSFVGGKEGLWGVEKLNNIPYNNPLLKTIFLESMPLETQPTNISPDAVGLTNQSSRFPAWVTRFWTNVLLGSKQDIQPDVPSLLESGSEPAISEENPIAASEFALLEESESQLAKKAQFPLAVEVPPIKMNDGVGNSTIHKAITEGDFPKLKTLIVKDQTVENRDEGEQPVLSKNELKIRDLETNRDILLGIVSGYTEELTRKIGGVQRQISPAVASEAYQVALRLNDRIQKLENDALLTETGHIRLWFSVTLAFAVILAACASKLQKPTQVETPQTGAGEVAPAAEDILAGGPDDMSVAEAAKTPANVPLVTIETQVPRSQNAFELDSKGETNYTKQLKAVKDRLHKLGITVVENENPVKDEVHLSGYESLKGNDYRWTIAGTTADGFVHAENPDGSLAGDPGYVGEGTGFVKLVDGFGSDVVRTWENYGGAWVPVVRDTNGNKLASFDFSDRSFNLDAENFEKQSKFKADKFQVVGEYMTFSLNGRLIGVKDAVGNFFPLDNGFAADTSGNYWEWNGKGFEQVKLPDTVPPDLRDIVKVRVVDGKAVLYYPELNLDFWEKNGKGWGPREFTLTFDTETQQKLRVAGGLRTEVKRTDSVHAMSLIDVPLAGVSYGPDGKGNNVYTLLLHYQGKVIKARSDALSFYKYGSSPIRFETSTSSKPSLWALALILKTINDDLPRRNNGILFEVVSPRKDVSIEKACGFVHFDFPELGLKCEQIYSEGEEVVMDISDFDQFLTDLDKLDSNWPADEKIPAMDINENEWMISLFYGD